MNFIESKERHVEGRHWTCRSIVSSDGLVDPGPSTEAEIMAPEVCKRSQMYLQTYLIGIQLSEFRSEKDCLKTPPNSNKVWLCLC